MAYSCDASSKWLTNVRSDMMSGFEPRCRPASWPFLCDRVHSGWPEMRLWKRAAVSLVSNASMSSSSSSGVNGRGRLPCRFAGCSSDTWLARRQGTFRLFQKSTVASIAATAITGSVAYKISRHESFPAVTGCREAAVRPEARGKRSILSILSLMLNMDTSHSSVTLCMSTPRTLAESSPP